MERFSLYFQGQLEGGVLLGTNIFFAYVFSLAVTLVFGLLSITRNVVPFSAKGMFVATIVPTILVTPFIVQALAYGSYSAFEAAVYLILLIPAVWLLPILSVHYGRKLRVKDGSERSPKVAGYAVVVVSELLAIAVLLYALTH